MACFPSLLLVQIHFQTVLAEEGGRGGVLSWVPLSPSRGTGFSVTLTHPVSEKRQMGRGLREGGGLDARAGGEERDFVQSGTGDLFHNLKKWSYHPICLPI